jgi:putative endopeptidase
MKTQVAAALCGGVIAVAFATTQAVFGPWGVTLNYIDSVVPPGADFFRYTNGGWLKTAVIPADRWFAGVNLELNQRNEAKLKAIVISLAVEPDSALSVEERKLRDLYNAFEDTDTIEAKGLTPVKTDLERIAALQTLADVAAFMAAPATEVSSWAVSESMGPFAARIAIDQKNPNAYVVRLTQSGLGMPDRDYYLRTDKDITATREAYKKYLTDMLAFAKITDPARAAAVYALESTLADAHWAGADRRDADKTYNPMTLAALEGFAPRFPWSAYFTAAGVARQSPRGERMIDVAEKSAFPKIAAVFAATSVTVWRDYFTVRYLHARADYLPR